MSTTIYILDLNSGHYVELSSHLHKLDERARKQIQRLAENLARDKKLDGMHVDYQGKNIWRVSVVNAQNYYELQYLRLGEEVVQKVADFRDDYRGPASLATLRIVIEVPVHPDYHRYNPIEMNWYNKVMSYTLEEYFQTYNFRDPEIAEVRRKLNAVFQKVDTSGVHEYSPVSYLIDIPLSSGRYVSFRCRVA
jgi:hypothetical protein